MPNYLTKEEIRQWRSSLEKITLEEFASRLGKVVEESKPTNDVVDIVMTKGTTANSNISDGFSAIAERAFKREQQISHTPFSIRKIQPKSAETKEIIKEQIKIDENISKIVKKTIKLEEQENKKRVKQTAKKVEKTIIDKAEEFSSKECNIVLKKSLTDREQLVFEYFVNNINKTVFAKDLALLLDLPRDYVYKYIKNLRAKIEGNRLQNVPSGGFILLGK